MRKELFLWLACCMAATVLWAKPVDYTNARVKKIAELRGVPKQSYQGMAIYGDYLVSLQNTGQATI